MLTIVLLCRSSSAFSVTSRVKREPCYQSRQTLLKIISKLLITIVLLLDCNSIIPYIPILIDLQSTLFLKKV
ncbi:hypothetical protein BDV3_004813 [Batrachochytrium dendrobatidis]